MYPEKKQWRQVWAGDQMDIQHYWDWVSNPGSVVHSGKEVLLQGYIVMIL